MTTKSTRDTLRSLTVGSPKTFKRTQVEYQGHEFEFVQPSLKVRKDIINKCLREDGNVDSIALMVESVLALTVIPDTDERVFEDADRAGMMERPSGSFVDVFAEKAVSVLTGISETEIKKD